MLFTSTF